MTKTNDSKYFDLRTYQRYLTNGELKQDEYKKYLKDLPNDEENFELMLIVEDDIGLGDELSEEELQSMPTITEDNINNFDFMEEKNKDDEV